MYRECISSFSENNKYVVPQLPANAMQIETAEEQLKIVFPQELRDLLLEMNGDRYLCLSVEEILQTNLEIRKGLSACYDGLESLLFIACNGCGDYYGYRIQNGICGKEILLWNHEENTIKVVAGSLIEMIQLYYTDQI